MPAIAYRQYREPQFDTIAAVAEGWDALVVCTHHRVARIQVRLT
jgi:hypothetical protein